MINSEYCYMPLYCNCCYCRNILLSNEGGPNHSGNLCDSLIYATAEHDGIGIGPMYYFMKHLSAFVQPGSVRLGSVTHGSYSAKRLGGRTSSVLRGFEATVWPCDGSVRQRWQLTPAGNVMLIDQMTEGFQVLLLGVYAVLKSLYLCSHRWLW
jgi:hypothetical protein